MKKYKSEGDNRFFTWFLVGFVVAATVVVIIASVVAGGKTGTDSAINTLAAPASSADWSEGNKDAKVVVVEYGDFQCPACGIYYPTVKRLISEYGDRVLFVFREFPLYQVHDDAGIAAQAAEAAGLQGKFWEMHDLLYEKQGEWSLLPFGLGLRTYFGNLATSIGLELNKFNADIDSTVVKNKISRDIEGANAAGVAHTPTFFINNKGIDNPNGYDDFKSILDKALSNP
jgi:protein-disulfide isomerase